MSGTTAGILYIVKMHGRVCVDYFALIFRYLFGFDNKRLRWKFSETDV